MFSAKHRNKNIPKKSLLSADNIRGKCGVINLRTFTRCRGITRETFDTRCETLIKCLSTNSRGKIDTRCENGSQLRENVGGRKCQDVYWKQYVNWLKILYLEGRAARLEPNLNGEMTYCVISSTQSVDNTTINKIYTTTA